VQLVGAILSGCFRPGCVESPRSTEAGASSNKGPKPPNQSTAPIPPDQTGRFLQIRQTELPDPVNLRLSRKPSALKRVINPDQASQELHLAAKSGTLRTRVRLLPPANQRNYQRALQKCKNADDPPTCIELVKGAFGQR
jgi:hypothetical protein